MAERRGDRALAARLDVEQRQREPLALLGERARRGRQAFALGERALERCKPLACERAPARRALALGANARVEHAPRPRELGAETVRAAPRALSRRSSSRSRALRRR